MEAKIQQLIFINHFTMELRANDCFGQGVLMKTVISDKIPVSTFLN